MTAANDIADVAGEAVPVACSLGAAALQGRVDEWRALLEHVVQRDAMRDGLRLAFAPSTPTDVLTRLVIAEQECCQFFAFAITVDARGIGLEVRAPAEGQPLVEALFGAAS
jgi:hypothetical protein